jgi:hypothetical protein
MHYIVAVGCLAIAIAMILVGKAHPSGQPKRFLRSGFSAEIYAVSCLAFFAAGVGLLVG